MKFEDVWIGEELPAAVHRPTTMDLVKYAAATGDYYQAHYDKDIAVEMGLPGVIVQGGLVLSYLEKMVIEWMGNDGKLEELGGSYRGIMPVNEEIFCHGKVGEKKEEEKEIIVELWAEDATGEKKVRGKAVIRAVI